MCKKNFRYLICYKVDDEKVNPLCIMLSKMSGYAKGFDETKSMTFFKNYELFKHIMKPALMSVYNA